MKKFLFYAAAVAAMAACTKTQVVYDDNDVEIGLSPVTYMTTKADPLYGIYKTNWYPSNEKFRVFSQYTQDPAGTKWQSINFDKSSSYFKDAVFVPRDAELWGGETPYYWPKTGSLFFAGYSPSDIPLSNPEERPTYVFANTGEGSYLTVPGFVQGSYSYTRGDEFSTFDYPEDYKMVDLMYFDVYSDTESINTEACPVLFKHALSWLTFNINCEAGFDGIFDITKVTLKNIASCATFNSGTGDGNADSPLKKAAWNYHTSNAPIVLFDAAESPEEDNTLTNAVKFEIDDVLIIPQTIPYYEIADPSSDQVMEIEYTMKAQAGENYVPAVQVPAQIKLSGGDGNGQISSQWLINKHYTYNITITGTKEILVKPSVATWSDVSQIKIQD